MQSSVRLIRVNPWEVPFWWEFVSGELGRALVHNNNETGLEDVWKQLVTGHHSLWVVYDETEASIRCVFTTFINDYPQKRTLFTTLLAGRGFREFSILEPELVQYAKDMGCGAIESFVIPGVSGIVQKALPEYKITHHVMVKEL